jgi:hypothetical protein
MPCSPAMTFCSIVGQAIFQTAGPMGPSTRDLSNERGFFCGGSVLTAGFDTLA